MKIPPKRVAQEQIQGQRKQQIDEGVLVAKKIDAMRAELANLQKQRLEVIENTSIEIEKANSELYKVKGELENNIKSLEDKRLELVKPLTEEWNKLTKVKEIFEKEMAMLIVQKTEQGQRELELNKIKEEIERKDNTTDNLKKQTYKLLEDAKKEKIYADEILKDAQSKSDEMRRKCDDWYVEAIEQQKNNKFDREANQNRAKVLDEKERELILRERQIKDRYETLQRSINRLKK